METAVMAVFLESYYLRIKLLLLLPRIGFLRSKIQRMKRESGENPEQFPLL
jgi:hypothetical protein